MCRKKCVEKKSGLNLKFLKDFLMKALKSYKIAVFF